MKLQSIKLILSSSWMVASAVAGLAMGPSSSSGWSLLTAFVVLPPAVMMWKWNDPPQSLSESIQRARR